MRKVVEVAGRVLLSFGLWVEDGISCSESRFFYLEPIKGRLPADTYEILTKKDIYMINPDNYFRGPNSKHGVIINVAACLNWKG